MKTNMKKTHWLRTTLIVLIICALVGTVIAGVKFMGNKAATYVSSSIQMNFSNAAKGLAPNGNRFDIQDMTRDEILQSALDASNLSGTYTPAQIRSSLQVRGVFPSDLEEQFTSYVSVLNENTGGTQMLTISDYHPTVFGVNLSNEFDTSISREQLTSLLENILAAYKTYFYASGANKAETGTTEFTVADYDYVQRLKIIRMKLESVTAYANEMKEKNSSFRLNGIGYEDIVVRLNNLISGDLKGLEGQVTVGALSKDSSRLVTQYQHEVDNLTDQLKYETEKLEKIEKLVEAYKKNATIYVSTAGALNKIAGNSAMTYDTLVAEQKEISENIAAIKVKLSDYQQKIENIKAGTVAAEENASEAESSAEESTVVETVSTNTKITDEAALQKIESDIERLISKAKKVIADFDNLIQAENTQKINDATVSISSVRYYTPKLLSGSFLMLVVKTAGPFCAIGFMVCMILIFISRRKEEKKN